MVEVNLKRSALAHLGLEAAATESRAAEHGVALGETPFRTAINLRGQPANTALMKAFGKALGVDLPHTPNIVAGAGDISVLWLGPEEWLATGPEESEERLERDLRAATSDHFASVSNVSDNYTALRISGPAARATLEKGCPLDLHPRVFGIGSCAQSLVSKTAIILERLEAEDAGELCYRLHVRRSFADYLWHWLQDAAREYGVTVLKSS